MIYEVSNFLAPYLSTSKTLKVLLPNGKVSFTLLVCNYQKALVKKNTISIILEDNNKEYLLTFNSLTEAKQAFLLFKTAIDLLKVNCESVSINFPPPPVLNNKFITVPFQQQPVSGIISNLTETTVSIGWTPVTNASHYELEYNLFGNVYSNIRIKNILIPTVSIVGLKKGSVYEYRVHAVIL